MAETIAFFAAGTILLAFAAPGRLWLRVLAVLANLVCIAWGLETEQWTVFALHAVLLPVNAAHLAAGLIRPPQAAGMRDSTISAHHDAPDGIALSSKS